MNNKAIILNRNEVNMLPTIEYGDGGLRVSQRFDDKTCANCKHCKKRVLNNRYDCGVAMFVRDLQWIDKCGCGTLFKQK